MLTENERMNERSFPFVFSWWELGTGGQRQLIRKLTAGQVSRQKCGACPTISQERRLPGNFPEDLEFHSELSRLRNLLIKGLAGEAGFLRPRSCTETFGKALSCDPEWLVHLALSPEVGVGVL